MPAPLRTVAALITLAVVTLVLASLAWLVALRNPASPVIEWIARRWAGSFLRVAGLTFEVEGRQHFQPGQSYVVVSNHLSNLDPMLHFLAVPVPVRFLAKKEIYRIPIFGSAIRAIGVVETDRRGGRAAHAAINERVEEVLIAYGRSLVIYPEGTRSRTGELQPFKKGAFHLAVRFGMPVVPCVIHGTRQAWPPGSKLIRGGHARVRFFPPISTEGRSLAEVEEVRDQARRVIEDAYRELAAQS